MPNRTSITKKPVLTFTGGHRLLSVLLMITLHRWIDCSAVG